MSSLKNTKLYEITKRLEKRLKEREDEYITYKQFHILVGTFNVNNRQPPSNTLLEEWFYRVTNNEETKHEIRPDIIAVGFQEIDTSSGAYIYDDKKKEDEWEQIVRKTIKNCYKSKDDNNKFQLLNRIRLMGILLFVYVRASLMPKCSLISRSSVPTGFMGIAGNKGGVGISFRFYETNICFINCHFASGDGQTQRRNEDYQTIESRMAFTDGPTYSLKDYIWYTPTTVASSAPNAETSATPTRWWKINDHDIVFWLGDMNYRISHANEQVRKAINELSTIPLHEKDQLRCEMKLNHVFKNYFEPSITFMPTYKFDSNTDNYDTSEKLRTPSWTDRILYHTKRTKIRYNNEKDVESIQPINYLCAKTIKFSDHRPVSGLYLVAIKYSCDEKRSDRIRDELIRQFDREENDSIPTIDVRPRPPAIIFNNIRYLDKVSYSLLIKNIGECPCTCTICPSSIFEPTRPIKLKQSSEEPFFDCLIFTPNYPYFIEIGDEQDIDISFQMKSQYSWVFGKQLNEILILHVENGADTFITLDITLDMGPFGLSFNQFPPPIYDTEIKQYIYSPNLKLTSERFVEMKNDPPALYILLIDCLKERNNLNLLNIFNNEVQDSIDLIPLRNQIYEHNYNFQNYSSIHLFMILLHLLQSLPEPLISRDIQDKIFLITNNPNHRSYHLPSGTSIQSHIPNESFFQHDMTKAVTIIIEQLKPKERNLFFRFLLLLQKAWPTSEQIRKVDNDARNVLNVCIDVLSLSILHEHADRNQRHAFFLACLNEEKKKQTK